MSTSRATTTLGFAAALLAASLGAAGSAGPAGMPAADRQPSERRVAAGVRHAAPRASGITRRELEAMRSLRFDVVLAGDALLVWTDLLLEGALEPRATGLGPQAVVDARSAGGPEIAARAWSALAEGARAVLFDDWAALHEDPEKLHLAAEFAGQISRNAPLYADLSPRQGAGVRTDDPEVDAVLLESPAALVLIAVNRSRGARRPTLTFSQDIPEAIWQNMLTGGAVNFVAGPEGPTYSTTLAPHGVLVLMIKKTWR